MRSLFKKHKKEAELKNDKQNIILDIWQKYYLITQDRWARKMSAITSKLSKSTLTYLFFLFVIISAGLNIHIILQGFSGKVPNPIKIVPISKFTGAAKKDIILNNGQEIVSKEELKRIFLFRSYLDSLQKTPLGKQSYDSISLYRPGLIDSLVFIENYYKSKD